MFATYNYSAGGTQQGVLDDLIAILTGETNVSNLSATCNKGATSITATIPAGWTLHDAAAGTVTKVIKAPLADDPIGIGGACGLFPLPHHRAYGSVHGGSAD